MHSWAVFGAVRRWRSFVIVVAVAVGVGAIPWLDSSDAGSPRAIDAASCGNPRSLSIPSASASDAGWRRLPPAEVDSCFSLVATRGDAVTVNPRTGFVFESRVPMTSDGVVAALRSTPAIRFRVEGLPILAASGHAAPAVRYRLEPVEPLAPGRIYRFALTNTRLATLHRWAFQVSESLRVVQTLPRNEATDVPPNTGIELVFSHDGVTGVEGRLSIEPPVVGRIEAHKRVVVFVPRHLADNTVYTVRLRRGVRVAGSSQRMADDYVFRFETGSGEDVPSMDEGPSLDFLRDVWDMPTRDAPVLGFSRPSGVKPEPKSLPFEVFRFDDAHAFATSLDQYSAAPRWAATLRFHYDTSRMAKVMRFEGRLRKANNEDQMFTRFPTSVPAGYYIVEATLGGRVFQTWLQVTDLSSYAAVSERSTLVWVNDLVTKRPLANATVRVLGSSGTAETGDDGVAMFRTPEGVVSLRDGDWGREERTTGSVLISDSRGRSAVAPLSNSFTDFWYTWYSSPSHKGDASSYWHFLHADRRLYRLSDTVRFWGLVRARENPRPSEHLTVEMSGWGGEDGSFVVARSRVEANSRGTFSGSMAYENLSPGWYSLDVKIGDETIASTQFDVAEFVTPAYHIDVAPSPKAAFAGERVRYDISARFFDGAPVPRLRLTYGGPADGRTTTDREGRAVVTARAAVDTDSDWFPDLSVAPEGAEEGEIGGSASVAYFPCAREIGVNATRAGGRGMVQGKVEDLDLGPINRGTSESPLKTPSAGIPVTLTVKEVTWHRVEEGESYDFIAKIVRKNYSYDRRARLVAVLHDVSDAGGRFSARFDAKRDRQYDVAARADDGAGRICSAETSLWDRGDWGYEYGSALYLSRGGSKDQDAVRLGDRISLRLMRGDKPLSGGENSAYLFYEGTNGIRRYSVRTKPAYALTFAEEHIPNVSVMGVWFNGVTYDQSVDPAGIRLDSETRRLSVSVTSDRARYRPGENVRIRVEVRDPQGQPASAEVLLAAVDEATESVEGEAGTGILEDLYGWVPSGVIVTRASHLYPRTGGGESGGEGPDRSNFEDVPLFTKVETGGDGRAEVSFRLPDNLTSWHVTGLAVTDTLSAGSGEMHVPVGLPVFVQVSMNDSFLVGDRPSIRMRAQGNALDSGDAARFTVKAPSLFEGTLRATGRAFEPADIALPAMKEGQHRITIHVDSSADSDGVVRTVSVVPTRLRKVTASWSEARAGATVAVRGSSDGLTRVVLADHNRGRYYPVLADLAYTYGDRIDQMMARDMSGELLHDYFREPAATTTEFDPAAYQTDDGGIALFPFAGSDLVLSARLASLAADRFDRGSLALYLRNVLDDRKETRERRIVALYGLAALDESVLGDVRSAAREKDLTPRERLYVGMALAESGDEDSARDVYAGMVGEFGRGRGAEAMLRVPGDRDDVLEATALGAVLGAALAEESAPALFEFVANERATDLLTVLEQVSYLSEALPRLSSDPVRFSYEEQGDRVEKTLDRGRTLALRLDPADLRALNLRVEEGVLGVGTSYVGPLDARSTVRDSGLSISRAYSGEDGRRVVLREGSLVRIRLYPEVDRELGATGCHQVTDYLPSGLRAVTDRRVRSADSEEQPNELLPYSVEGQRVSFCLYRGYVRPFDYYARVVTLGRFTAEPPVIQSLKSPSSLSIGEPAEVTIR